MQVQIIQYIILITFRVFFVFFWAKITKTFLLLSNLVPSFNLSLMLCNRNEELHERLDTTDAIVFRCTQSSAYCHAQ